jgi:hypothetical protein
MSRNKIFLLFFAATTSFDLDSLEEILAYGRSSGSSFIPENCINGNSNDEISLARSRRSSDDWVVQMLAPISCESQRCQKVPLIVEKMVRQNNNLTVCPCRVDRSSLTGVNNSTSLTQLI